MCLQQVHLHSLLLLTAVCSFSSGLISSWIVAKDLNCLTWGVLCTYWQATHQSGTSMNEATRSKNKIRHVMTGSVNLHMNCCVASTQNPISIMYAKIDFVPILVKMPFQFWEGQIEISFIFFLFINLGWQLHSWKIKYTTKMTGRWQVGHDLEHCKATLRDKMLHINVMWGVIHL